MLVVSSVSDRLVNKIVKKKKKVEVTITNKKNLHLGVKTYFPTMKKEN